MSDSFENNYDSDVTPEQPVHSAPFEPEQPVHSAPAEPEQPVYSAPVEPERSAYSDAGFESSADASAVPKSYHCASQERKPKRERVRRERRGMRAGGVVALCLVCAILGGLAGGFLPGLIAKQTFSDNGGIGTVESRPTTPAPPAGSETVINVAGPGTTQVTTRSVSSGKELTATEIYYDLAIKQVVNVKVNMTVSNGWYSSQGVGIGTGFIISSDGYILTNYHLFENAIQGKYDVAVSTYSGEEYAATLVGYESDHDMAVLKIEATGLTPVTIGNSDEMLVGEAVYVVGNPSGELEYSMTDGIVSAKDRTLTFSDSNTGTRDVSMFQLSAPISGGNSGGPVYNSRGEVVGIATAKYRNTANFENLTFAIPINDAIKCANDIITDGYVRGKAYMGITTGTVTAAAAQYYGLVQGAIVASVIEGSAAEKAGLKESDIIVAMDDTEIHSMEDLTSAKKNYSAGDTAVLKVYRSGEYLELSITFDEAVPEEETEETEEAAEPEAPAEPGESFDGGNSYDDFFRQFFGMSPFGR